MTTRLLLALSVLALGATLPAVAQSQEAMPNFDLLKAAHGADSLRRTAVRLQAELTKLAKSNGAKSDTIVAQRRELERLRALQATLDTAVRGGPRASTRDTAVTARPVAALVVAPVPVPVKAATPTAPAAPVAVPVTTPVATVTPAAPQPASPAAAPRSSFPTSPVISGMVQFWISGGDAGLRNTYRLRRAEVKASGNATPTLSWVLMLDLGKTLSATSVMTGSTVQTSVAQSGRPLQDAMMSAQVNPSLRIDAGQQKIPFGLEGAQSSSSLETVERALFASDRARGGSFGDMRDLGVTARGRWTNAVDYQVGAFNGSGESQNDVDANQAKAIIGRVAVRPIPAVQLGVSGVYAGNTAADAPRRDRDGVDLRIRSGKVLIQAEAVSGHDALIGRHGMYTLAGYRLLPTTDVHLRFDAWDPDVQRESDAASATQRDYLAGVTWIMPGAGFKAQADIARRTWSAGITPSRWQLLINLQTSW